MNIECIWHHLNQICNKLIKCNDGKRDTDQLHEFFGCKTPTMRPIHDFVTFYNQFISTQMTILIKQAVQRQNNTTLVANHRRLSKHCSNSSTVRRLSWWVDVSSINQIICHTISNLTALQLKSTRNKERCCAIHQRNSSQACISFEKT